jgi:hypothetical protein
VSWFARLVKGRPKERIFQHDAPDLESTLPATVAGRLLVRWSVAGGNFWKVLGGDRVRSGWASDLGALGLSADEIAMAVAGRGDTSHDPPYIIWVLRFGNVKGSALRQAAPSSLAMGVMNVNPNQGEDWRDTRIAGKRVLVGHRGMVRQDDHHRGIPVVYLSTTAIFALIADDDAWSEEVIRALPAT